MAKEKEAAPGSSSPLKELALEFDSKGTILRRLSEGPLKLLPPGDHTGKNIADVLPPPAAKEILSCIKQALSSGKVLLSTHEFAFETQKQSYEVRTIPISGDRVIRIVRNVTAQKRSEERLRVLTTAIEQSPRGVLIANTQGVVEFVNAAFCALTGLEEADVLGGNIRNLPFGPGEDLQEAIGEGKFWEGQVQRTTASGKNVWLSMTMSPLRNSHGDITHYLAMQEDITRLKQLEARS